MSCFQACFGMNTAEAPTPPKWRPDSATHDMSSNHGFIANKWEHLMGHDHWEGLLDPLDIDLRRTIIHYGELAQATYDTFISEKLSKYTGASRFSKNNFLEKLSLELGRPYKYRVTKFIYATSGIEVPDAFIFKSLVEQPWMKDSNFMGFVAVAEDETVELLGRRDIVVAWRGSIKFLEWINDFQFLQVSASDVLGHHEGDESDKPKVHQGWYSVYTSDNKWSPFDKTCARDQVLKELSRLVEKYKNEEISITVTGHSLGAALATLNAVDIVANNINKPKHPPKNAKPCIVTALVFASPRVGDANFKKLALQYDDLRVLRIRNAHDMVPNYPLIDYSDVGDEMLIDTTKSPYLKDPGAPLCKHNLEVYMHGVAGVHGLDGDDGFKLVVERDVAVLNKGFDILKDEYLIPVGWWVQKFKGMVQQSDGSWLLMDCEKEDDDV